MKHIGNLTYTKGAKHSKKKIGRGPGSGHGGTSTRGHKGQKSRSGATIATYFEGGQMPLQRRVPKFGFTNPTRVEYQPVNLTRIQQLIEAGKIQGTVDREILIGLGVIRKKTMPFKVLGVGEIKSAVNFKVDGISQTAKDKIEQAGGTVEVNG